MIYVKVNNTLYPASIAGRISDKEWDGRESRAITLTCGFQTADALLPDCAQWSIVEESPEEDGASAAVIEYDNSEFSVRGDLTVHVNGTCTVHMGKPTDLENAYEILYGGVGA